MFDVRIPSHENYSDVIIAPPAPMALRMSSILMSGIVILYQKQQHFLLEDFNSFINRVQTAMTVNLTSKTSTLMQKKRQAKSRKITISSQYPFLQDLSGLQDIVINNHNEFTEIDPLVNNYDDFFMTDHDVRSETARHGGLEERNIEEPSEKTLLQPHHLDPDYALTEAEQQLPLLPENEMENQGVQNFIDPMGIVNQEEILPNIELDIPPITDFQTEVEDIKTPARKHDSLMTEGPPQLVMKKKRSRVKFEANYVQFVLEEHEQMQISRSIYQNWLEDSNDLCMERKTKIRNNCFGKDDMKSGHNVEKILLHQNSSKDFNQMCLKLQKFHLDVLHNSLKLQQGSPKTPLDTNRIDRDEELLSIHISMPDIAHDNNNLIGMELQEPNGAFQNELITPILNSTPEEVEKLRKVLDMSSPQDNKGNRNVDRTPSFVDTNPLKRRLSIEDVGAPRVSTGGLSDPTQRKLSLVSLPGSSAPSKKSRRSYSNDLMNFSQFELPETFTQSFPTSQQLQKQSFMSSATTAVFNLLKEKFLEEKSKMRLGCKHHQKRMRHDYLSLVLLTVFNAIMPLDCFFMFYNWHR